MPNVSSQKTILTAITAILAVATLTTAGSFFFNDWRSPGDDWYWDCTTAWYDSWAVPLNAIPTVGDNVYIDDDRTCIFRTNDDLGNPVESPSIRYFVLGDWQSGGHLVLNSGEYTFTSELGMYAREMETSIIQSGGEVISNLRLASKHARGDTRHHDANSIYTLYDGKITADGGIVSGYSVPGPDLKCKHTFNIYGGEIQTNEFSMAKPDCNSVVEMTGGTLQIYDFTGTGSQIDLKLGWAGAKEATFNFGNEESTGLITSLPGQNANMWLLKNVGIFNGWGPVELAHRIFNDGIVQANGYGVERDLDMSVMDHVRNSNDNLVGEDNGWYAINKGRLILPSIAVATGSNVCYWAENAGDDDIDLINSAKLTFTAAAESSLSGSLLDNNRSDVPGALRAIGVWDFTGPAITGNASLVIRYDEFLAADLGITEADLKLYHYENDQWVDITSSVNTTKKQINGSANSLGFFSVGIPIDTPINCSEVHKIGQGYAGDLNLDCIVNVDDILMFASQWLTSDPINPPAYDLNGDKTVNMEDFSVIAEDWLKDNNPVITE